MQYILHYRIFKFCKLEKMNLSDNFFMDYKRIVLNCTATSELQFLCNTRNNDIIRSGVNQWLPMTTHVIL